MWVRTHHGIATVSLGDGVIKQIDAEIYPCKPDIFALTYKSVDG